MFAVLGICGNLNRFTFLARNTSPLAPRRPRPHQRPSFSSTAAAIGAACNNKKVAGDQENQQSDCSCGGASHILPKLQSFPEIKEKKSSRTGMGESDRGSFTDLHIFLEVLS
ncbi:unnamed protein product [Cuscuta europaea]|uniref:Uncharacterized protein n=1 Tax=Cuscuta europaea TaxID=41803 RepID=A0A9P1EGS3_CUSEU|nr:unnamed protein product [Cuscuta europaea]